MVRIPASLPGGTLAERRDPLTVVEAALQGKSGAGECGEDLVGAAFDDSAREQRSARGGVGRERLGQVDQNGSDEVGEHQRVGLGRRLRGNEP